MIQRVSKASKAEYRNYGVIIRRWTHPRLIRQTLRKIEIADPEKIQTGPDRRGDESTISLHMKWLEKHAPEYSQLYEVLTEAIIKKYEN